MKRRIIAGILTLLIMLWAADFYLQDGFDIRIFIVFLTLGWLACYKLVDYLAQLKIIEKNSRIDIVFVCAVIAVMFVPLLKISHETVSVQENRNLAEYEPLIQDGKINFNYGPAFEQWFNDHFNQRDRLIALNSRLNLLLNRKLQSDRALQGKDNWLFTTRWNSVAMFRNANLFSENELEKITEKMQQLQTWCAKRGIKFYIMLIPDKERLYGEYYPDGYEKAGDLSRLEQISAYLENHTHIPVIDIYGALLKAKDQHTLYYKTGTHWNLRGAYIGYRQMMNILRRDFPDLKILQENDFDIQWRQEADIDLASALGVNAYDTFPAKDMTYEVFSLKNPQTYQQHYVMDKQKRIEFYDYNSNDPAQKYRAVFLADSQFLRMNWYVAESFEDMLHIYIGYGKMYDFPAVSEKITEFAPEIFVLETGERFLERLLKIEIPDR